MRLHYHAVPKFDGTATIVRVEVDGDLVGKLEFPPGKWHQFKRWMELSAATMSITRIDIAGGVHLELHIVDGATIPVYPISDPAAAIVPVSEAVLPRYEADGT